MKRWFLGQSLLRKLRIVAMLPLAIFAAMSLVIFEANQIAALRGQTENQLRGIAGITAVGVHAALAFADHKSAEDWLRALSERAEIESVRVHANDGSVFAERTFHRNAERTDEDLWRRAAGLIPDRRLQIEVPVKLDGDIVGQVRIDADLSEMWARIVRSLVLMCALLLVLTGIALAIIGRLSRWTEEPLMRLSNATRHISRTNDYSLRVKQASGDELGVLVQGFNSMLEHIEQTDQALREHRDRLESEVEARTLDLRRAVERIRLAVDCASLILWDWDLDRDQIILSEQWSSLSGGPPRETVVASGAMGKWIHPEDFAQVRGVNLAALKGQTDLSDVTFRMRVAATGEWIWLRSAGRVTARHDDGRVRRKLGMFINVTAAKQREAELERAREAAVAASRAKSEFLATMSHEIRTPLNGVLGMAQLLVMSGLNAAQAKMAQTLHGSAESLLGVINDILDFSKIEAGRLDLEKLDFHFAALANDVVDLFAEQASRKGLLVQAHISEQLPVYLRGDPLRIRQVLSNLVSNAIKFTASGSVTLSVAPSGTADGNVTSPPNPNAIRVDFQIQDTGIGIDAASATRLFQPFTQADGSMARKYGGSGLGLAICRRLVDAMGGEISLSSTPGKGTTVNFTLPMETALSTTHKLKIDAVPTTSLRGSVLLAEDHAINFEIASAMMEQMGLDVTHARDGREAVALATTGKFDLILMDCQMPDVDGFEATRRIRQWETQRQEATATTPGRIPIIAITANAMAGDRERCLAAGMDDYVSKPFRREQLHAALASRLPSRDQSNPVPADPNDDPTAAGNATASLIDMGVIRNLRRMQRPGKPDLLGRLIALFHEDAPNRVNAMKTALSQGDTDTVRQTAHMLKSGSASIGAMTLSARFREIEEQVRSDALAGCEKILDEIDRSLPDVLRALREAGTVN